MERLWWGFLDLLMNNFLVLALVVLGIIVIGYSFIAFLKKKDYVKGGVLAALSALIFGAAHWASKNNKDKYKEQIKEVDRKIDDKKEELKKIDAEMEENKKKAEKLKQEQEVIVDTLAKKLDEAENIKPVEVKTDEEVLDTFASIINRNSHKS